MSIRYSIIIPTWNRVQVLKRCLQHILQLTNPSKKWEVLVVNNNSTDNTEEVVNGFRDKFHQLRYFNEKNAGLHVGRNLGCDNAKGEILCYLDDDSFVTKKWLEGIEKAFADFDVALVGGPCIPEYEVEPPKWVEQLYEKTESGKINGYLSLIDYGDQAREIPAIYVYGCNFSIRKDVLLECGGFHPDAMPKHLLRFRGDGETGLSQNIEKLGYKTLYHPDVRIHHLVPESRMTIDYFCHRAYIQGISNSFVQIREKWGINRYEDKTRRKGFLLNKIDKIIQKRVQSVKGRIFHADCEEVRKIAGKIRKCREKGYAFHQKEVKKDPKFLEWVLRKNYLGENGRLPE